MLTFVFHCVDLIVLARGAFSEPIRCVQDKATAETLRVELEGWGRFQRVLDENWPKKG
jgi:hypothetical protein